MFSKIFFISILLVLLSGFGYTQNAVDRFNPARAARAGNQEYETAIKAVEHLEDALKLAPNRLDIWFGKINILNEIGDHESAGQRLRMLLEFSREINNQWLWSNDEKIEDGEEVFLFGIQDYYMWWYELNTEESLAQIKQSAERQIELYPEHLYAYNNLGVYYHHKQQIPEAIKYFLQAEKVDPEDCIAPISLGRIYLELNDRQKAREYFLRVFEIGDAQEREYALHFLEELE